MFSWLILSTSFQSVEKQPSIKLTWSKFDQWFSLTLDLHEVGFENTFGTIVNWERWSEIVAVRLTEIASKEIAF